MDIDDLGLHVSDDNRLLGPPGCLQHRPIIPAGRIYVNYSTYNIDEEMAVAPIFPLQPPEKFNFKLPDDWPRWKRQFRIASGLGKEDDE